MHVRFFLSSRCSRNCVVESRSFEAASSPAPLILPRTTTSRCLRTHEPRYKTHVFTYIERALRGPLQPVSARGELSNDDQRHPTSVSPRSRSIAATQFFIYSYSGYLEYISPLVSLATKKLFSIPIPITFHGEDWFASLCPGRIRPPSP